MDDREVNPDIQSSNILLERTTHVAPLVVAVKNLTKVLVPTLKKSTTRFTRGQKSGRNLRSQQTPRIQIDP